MTLHTSFVLFRSSRFYLWPIIFVNVIVIAAVLSAPLLEAGYLALALCLLASFGFLLNDFVDRSIDAKNQAYRLEAVDQNTLRLVLPVAAAYFTLGAGIGYLIAPVAFTFLMMVGLGLVLYSYLFRRLLVFSNLSAALLGTSCLWVPLLLWQSSFSPFYWVMVMSAFVYLLSREILLDVKDAPGDLHGGRSTIPVVFGSVVATRLALLMALTASLLLLIAAIKYSAIDDPLSYLLFLSLTILLALTMTRQPYTLLKRIHDGAAMWQYVYRSRIVMFALPLVVIAQFIL